MTMERKLQYFEIAGNMPYGLHVKDRVLRSKDEPAVITSILGITWPILSAERKNIIMYINLADIIPVLRPFSDLYRTISHNEQEIIPIVELAKICDKHKNWVLGNECAVCNTSNYYFGYNGDFMFYNLSLIRLSHISNKYQLFDYLNSIFIDYRGLIDAGLAIDANTLESNPYK